MFIYAHKKLSLIFNSMNCINCTFRPTGSPTGRQSESVGGASDDWWCWRHRHNRHRPPLSGQRPQQQKRGGFVL